MSDYSVNILGNENTADVAKEAAYNGVDAGTCYLVNNGEEGFELEIITFNIDISMRQELLSPLFR